MKKTLFLFILAIIVNNAFTQGHLNNKKFYSPNNNYSIEIRGYFYSDFSGSCQYIFYDSSQTTLWEKVLNYAGIPNLSNSGEVAIPRQGNTIFLNTNGDVIFELKNIYNQQGQKYPLSGGCDPQWHKSPHGYSSDGNYYFITAGNEKSDKTYLYCYTKNGEESWKSEFENFCPDNINTKRGLVFLDNLSGAGINLTNELFILNLDSGKIIRKFELKILNPHVKHLIIEDDGFIFYKDELRKYDFQCESFRRLTDVEIRDLIVNSNDEDKIIVGLDYLNRFGDINLLKNDTAKLCELIFKTEDQLIKRLITSSLSSLNVNCY
jgi:hypothetical protein